MPLWPEDLRYSIEVFDQEGRQIKVLGRLADLTPARAAYDAILKTPRPTEEIVMLCWKAQVLRRSDRGE